MTSIFKNWTTDKYFLEKVANKISNTVISKYNWNV